MTNKTPLYDRHVAAGARMVDFGGWDMPLHYGSQMDEHHAVRQCAGLFDVSHMTVVDVVGPDSKHYLQKLLANDVARLGHAGKGLYSCMLNEAGGVVDDLIVYKGEGSLFRVVVNAATREQDLDWTNKIADGYDVEVCECSDLVMLAVQGPQAAVMAEPLLPAEMRQPARELKPFNSVAAEGWFIARTGYTGEDGWEIMMDVAAGCQFWDAALAAGIQPCGLGARDTLRLEAGLSLYGQDMDQSVSPLVSALGWTIAWEPEDRAFIGREALEQQRSRGPGEKIVGLILEERGIMRHGQRVITDAGDGIVTSGGFSPTMQRSIALARVPSASTDTCQVQIRNDQRNALIVRPPFVRNGRILIDI